MRIVVCDDDDFMRDMVEALIGRTGHVVAGVADSTATAVGLIEAARPDVVVLDISLGYNTDFDIIASTIDVGALAIVFSHNHDLELLGRYRVEPILVAKPDLTALERTLAHLEQDDHAGVVEQDRRQRPGREASGPPPTGVSDAQAFFEAINDALEGDAMISIEVSRGSESLAEDITSVMRSTDRLMAFPTAVRIYLPGGGEAGTRSLLGRITETGALDPCQRVASILVEAGEAGATAFDRLKQTD